MSPTTEPESARRGVERALASQRRRYEDELERLLDATFQVMRDRDTANPSVTDILATSGLSTTAFYRHFPTKDDLLITLLERAHTRTKRHLEERLGAELDPRARVGEWVRAMFDMLRTDDLVTANRPFLLAHPRLLERFPAEIGAGFDALTEPLADAIADARRAASLSTESAADDARLAMHHVFGILIDRAALRRRSDPQTIAAVTSYTLRAVLTADPVPTRAQQSAGVATP
ncbi:TetR/AcrR family transcriptional regulator [Frankia sp. AgB1.9]|uniref:TetR/AcrR family transcriptional regulator n=1 Tax=unclassified Frankia TaxID=2632575 RepID=UPI001933EDAD|nr:MULTISPECIES: TetR/AcrR family transcriptional regulator [unclassified Frankia]MBL7491432.1 TetR/AcrR family transcriptional regulator [Frankia sp. AgW1.1]MBL7553781.1 TetR/AcrR family transcriptional regulator [Frankia sp. AgB1.9]MBL7620958.1 TetR/AcrR family transcriptional regulator [Frankia sp. AgB1.8]